MAPDLEKIDNKRVVGEMASVRMNTRELADLLSVRQNFYTVRTQYSRHDDETIILNKLGNILREY